MLKNVSLFTLIFCIIALISGDADRIAHGLVPRHIITPENVFDLSHVWFPVRVISLGLGFLSATAAVLLIIRTPQIKFLAMMASMLMVLLCVMCLESLVIQQLYSDGLIDIDIQSLQAVAFVHWMLDYIIVWCSFFILLNSRPTREAVSTLRVTVLSIAMTLVVLLSGVWVSLNDAGRACPDFQLCVEQWWLGLDWAALFAQIQNGELPAFKALSDLVVWHSVFALILSILLVTLVIAGLARKVAPAIRNWLLILLILLVFEHVSGVLGPQYGQYIPLTHKIIAALLMLPLIAVYFFTRYEYLPESPARRELVKETKPEAKPGEIVEAEYQEPAPESLYLRLKSQLKKTRSGLGQVLAEIGIGQRRIGIDLLEELETQLIMADLGMDATTAVIKGITDKLERRQLNDGEVVLAALKNELLDILQPCSQPLVIPKQDKPYVILVVGINGVGKTTTIGKMAKRLHAQGHSVMLAAGDTFRAAAVEQLQVWGQRNNIHVVAQHTGADSASVIYDGVQSALAKGVDVLIADTAGRLHTKSNLMDELKKVKRIIAKLDETAPHEVLLVLDAGTGQNAISQTALFNEAVALTGLVLTKLDGTAKGGILFALAKQFGLPIRYIGIGEGIDDLQDFDAENFIDALFVKDD